MRVAIFGAGAVGAYFGARLAATGESVVFIARGANLEALKNQGLRIESPVGDLHLPSVEATDGSSLVKPVDVVLVAVKTWQLEAGLATIQSLAGERAWVLPLLNGVEAGAQLSKALGAGRVVGGTCRIIAHLADPGRIVHVGATPSIDLGELDGQGSRRTKALCASLNAAGIRTEIPANIQQAIWRKFLFVVSLGGVGAVARAPLGEIRRRAGTRDRLEQAMREIKSLANARGVGLPKGTVAKSMAFVDQLPASGTTSLQRDLVAGRRSELEAWTGAVVRLARESAIVTPVHDALYAELLPLELRARKDPKQESKETGSARPL